MVRVRQHRHGLRFTRAPVPGRRDDLVESLRPGARALRRRRYRPPAARAGRADRLAAAATSLWAELARALEPPGAVRFDLPDRRAATARLVPAGSDATPRA